MSADELRAYVTADEPPMTLTADRLLKLGRRRHRLRLLGPSGAVAERSPLLWLCSSPSCLDRPHSR